MPTEIVVAPDECRLSAECDVLVARHLTSDWAIVLHHPEKQIGALARFSRRPEVALRQAFSAMRTLVASPDRCRAYVLGGAAAPGDEQAVQLARSVRLAIEARLWREGVLLKGEDCGGSRRRSLYFHPSSGRLIVRSAEALVPRVQQTALPCPLAS